jgi:protein subunit release factor B
LLPPEIQAGSLSYYRASAAVNSAFRSPKFELRKLNFELPALRSRVLSPDPASAERMRRLGLRLEEFEEVFSRSGGPGGQHVNKVATAVTLIHLPSGISLTVQDTRSQYRNRQLAVHRLMTLIDQKRKREMTERQADRERKRRQNSRRPRSLRREIRKSKERRAEIKQTRTKVSPE